MAVRLLQPYAGGTVILLFEALMCSTALLMLAGLFVERKDGDR
jgi:hypothetical protein